MTRTTLPCSSTVARNVTVGSVISEASIQPASVRCGLTVLTHRPFRAVTRPLTNLNELSSENGSDSRSLGGAGSAVGPGGPGRPLGPGGAELAAAWAACVGLDSAGGVGAGAALTMATVGAGTGFGVGLGAGGGSGASDPIDANSGGLVSDVPLSSSLLVFSGGGFVAVAFATASAGCGGTGGIFGAGTFTRGAADAEGLAAPIICPGVPFNPPPPPPPPPPGGVRPRNA